MCEFARLPLRECRRDRLTICGLSFGSLVRRHHILLVHSHLRTGDPAVSVKDSVWSEDSSVVVEPLSDRDGLVFCAESCCLEQPMEERDDRLLRVTGAGDIGIQH